MSDSLLIYIWNSACSVYMPFSIKNFILRIRFLLLGLLNWNAVREFVNARDNECFHKELIKQNDKLGILVWPYIHNEWGFEKKSQIIREHYHCVNDIPKLCIQSEERFEVLDLDKVKSGLKVIIDRGQWFKREGELVLNIFLAEDRIYSLAFSLGQIKGLRVAYIGGIQGVSLANVMDIYKQITKALYGMRPKDFLLNVLKAICSQIEVSEIVAISNENRHHNHSYFSNYDHNDALADYDKMWIEQGFNKSTNGFYSTSVEIGRRPLDEIASKKRSMYRKRYALLDDITNNISTKLTAIK